MFLKVAPMKFIAHSLLPVVTISPLTDKVVSQVVLNVLYKPVATESSEDLLARM